MRSWQLAVFCLVCLAAAGCRTHPAVALLERENRDLEDQLYGLADLLEQCRAENARLRSRLEGSEEGYTRPAGSALPLELEGPALGPGQRRAAPPGVPTELEPPAVEVPSVEIPGEEFLERSRDRGASVPPDAFPVLSSGGPPEWPSSSEGPDLVNEGADTTDGASQCLADNTQVAAVTLNDRLTGGYNLDGRPGHEGIIAVIEPRDTEGRPVAAAAPVSVVVLDPALSGDAARVARWDFTPEQVAKCYRKTPLSEGIHLEMVWPAALPVHSRLHVFVRYVTDDGRKIEADKGIEVEVPALQAQRPLRAPHAARADEPGQPTAGWQGKPSPVTPLPATEPARIARVPAEPESRPVEPPESASRPIAPKRQAPAWSPDRP